MNVWQEKEERDRMICSCRAFAGTQGRMLALTSVRPSILTIDGLLLQVEGGKRRGEGTPEREKDDVASIPSEALR